MTWSFNSNLSPILVLKCCLLKVQPIGNMVECGGKVGVKLVRAKSGLGFQWDRLGRQGGYTCALTHLFQFAKFSFFLFSSSDDHQSHTEALFLCPDRPRYRWRGQKGWEENWLAGRGAVMPQELAGSLQWPQPSESSDQIVLAYPVVLKEPDCPCLCKGAQGWGPAWWSFSLVGC